MKLPDFLSDTALTALREKVGAPLRDFVAHSKSETLTIAEIESLAREGLDIPLEDVRTLDDGTLAYKGRRVVLYIRDVKQYRRADVSDLPRFHVANCDKLEEMRSNNRYERYVVATRDDGIFQTNIKRFNSASYEKADHALNVCQLCLGRLDWEGFRRLRSDRSARKRAVADFTLSSFFEKYPRSAISAEPKHDALSAPLNDYTHDFKEVAERLKAARGFRCEVCRIDLSKHRRFLHAHHKNGQQQDNSEENIAILCIRHHAGQYAHGHLKHKSDYREFVRLFPTEV